MTISPKRLEELKNIPENAIDTSDIPELDASFWEKAELVKPTHPTKETGFFTKILHFDPQILSKTRFLGP